MTASNYPANRLTANLAGIWCNLQPELAIAESEGAAEKGKDTVREG